MRVEDVDVVVVGAGPIGLMLAGELALAGVRPVVLERLPQRSEVPKANGLVGQVVRWLDHRGLYQRLTGDTRAPQPTPAYMFGGMPLSIGYWPDSPLHIMRLPQWDLEVGLAQWVADLGVRVRRGFDVTGCTQDWDGVTVTGSATLRARFVVGCDGAHSVVRKQAGVDFPGVSTDRVVSRTAHVVLPLTASGELDVPGMGRLRPFTYHRTDRGLFVFATFQPGVQLVTAMEWDQPDDDSPATIEDVRAGVARVLGVDVPMMQPTQPGRWVLRRVASRSTRQADRYRAGRILVAGDAAHVHAAVGGPGLNLGLLDVANLGWKLAATVQGWAPPGLLDTYHDERHPVGQRVVMHTQAQTALLAPGSEVTALRELFGELMAKPDNARYLATLLAGADARYGGEHGLVGAWVPDFPLTVAGQPTRLAELARAGRPLLLDLVGDPALAEVATGWADRVDLIVATAANPPADALLIRPDGHAAWTADSDRPLAEALRDWFGEPAGCAGTPTSGRTPWTSSTRR
ncbi:MAG TPA: FAD-dependent monooxygenase [Pseudonocardiaceae bacterium]|nr:FAD-dependent monooxygenase [Pseudonocardiaceae bacterium]